MKAYDVQTDLDRESGESAVQINAETPARAVFLFAPYGFLLADYFDESNGSPPSKIIVEVTERLTGVTTKFERAMD